MLSTRRTTTAPLTARVSPIMDLEIWQDLCSFRRHKIWFADVVTATCSLLEVKVSKSGVSVSSQFVVSLDSEDVEPCWSGRSDPLGGPERNYGGRTDAHDALHPPSTSAPLTVCDWSMVPYTSWRYLYDFVDSSPAKSWKFVSISPT